MSVTAVRQGLKDAVSTVSGLRASAYKRDTVNPPCAEVTPGEWDPRTVLDADRSTREFIVTLYGGRTSEDTAQTLLDGYCEMSGATSVINAIQSDADLNGGTTADYAQVTNVSELIVVTVGAIDLLAVRLTVEVAF